MDIRMVLFLIGMWMNRNGKYGITRFLQFSCNTITRTE